MTALLVWILMVLHPPVPGAVDHHVTQSNIHRTVCVAGYTARVRPPTSYTTPLKHRLAEVQGVDASNYELDHLVPLALGGSPRSPRNLWLEPWSDARVKDADEVRLQHAVCKGTITLRAAQRQILGEWR